MPLEKIVLTKTNSSSFFAALPFATAQVSTEVYPSSGYMLFDLFISDVESNVHFDDVVFPESLHAMIASERVLARDWDQPDEDAAWANL